MPRLVLLVCFFISCGTYAQTSNDDIENRIEVFQDAIIESYTNGNTVQWNCVDERLTGKCIKYHNDQWFYFTALNSKRQYINISNQDCRDLWGVQLVVIDGIPCETESYKIKACVSLASQDDIFTTLDNLDPGKQYLVNVDGYLHDYCFFKMELSLTPKGLPITQPVQLEASNQVTNDTLVYNWQTPDSLLNEINFYRIYRRKADEFKFTLMDELLAKLNAYGAARQEYKYSEVITGDNNPWTYKLVAHNNELSYVVDEFEASANWLNKVKTRYRIFPEIKLRRRAELSVTLLDFVPGVVLEEKRIQYFPKENRPFYFDVTDYIDLGVTRFQVVIINLTTGEKEFVDYEYTKGGGIEKMR